MRVSVVTPTIDRSTFIDEAVASVERQGYRDVEHIVVHDGSRAFTDALQKRHPQLKILAGSGQGPTAAIAAGIAAATGEFVFFLSSDDRLAAHAFAALDQTARARPEVGVWTGGTRIFRTAEGHPETTIRELVSPRATAATLVNLLDGLTLYTARFIRRSVYTTLGNLDLRFPESSDREFLVRAALEGIVEVPLGVIVSELRQHAGSHTMHGVRNVVPPYLAEHLRLADLWLGRSGLPPSVVRGLHNWRAREALRAVLYQLRAGQRQQAMRSLCAAVSSDPLWLLRATTVLAAWWRRHRS